MTTEDLGDLVSGYQSFLPVLVFVLVYSTARRAPGKEITVSVWIGLAVASLNALLLFSLFLLDVRVSTSQVLGMWVFAPFALFAGFAARSKNNRIQSECDALDPWKTKLAEGDAETAPSSKRAGADDATEESSRLELLTPKKAALFLTVVVVVAVSAGTIEYVMKVRQNNQQRTVERCPDFGGFDRWNGSYDSQSWEIELYKASWDIKISEWLRDDGQASFEVYAAPLQRGFSVATLRPAVLKALRNQSDTKPTEFEIRGFTCWRATAYLEGVLRIDVQMYDHETSDIYMIAFYCNAEEGNRCHEEIDALLVGSGWHEVGKKLPYLSEWAAQPDSGS